MFNKALQNDLMSPSRIQNEGIYQIKKRIIKNDLNLVILIGIAKYRS
jgi:hypothetical protein